MAITATFPRYARVKVHPATDAFMQGDVYGNVQRSTESRKVKGREIVHVLMDRSNKVRRFTPDLLEQI